MMKVARRAEARATRRWKARNAAKYGTPERERADRLYEQADALMRRLWDLEGPDPMAAFVAAHADDVEPNPDDPDDV